MLEVIIEDSLTAAVAAEMAAALARERPRLAALVDSATARAFASPGIFLPHLHPETAGGEDSLAAAGVTSWTLAVFGTDFASLEREMARIAVSPLAAARGFRGVFVEGPFIAAGTAAFDAKSLEAFLDAAALPVAAMAFAPERADAGVLLPLLDERDVCAVIGHTNAGFDACKAAFDQGAVALSLPFVATPALHHRSPGPLGAAAAASARCEAPVGMPGFTPEMAAFVAAVFDGRTEPVYHPAAHPGPMPEGALPKDFARRAARFMSLPAAQFLSLYGGAGADRTCVLFDEDLSVLVTVIGGKAAYDREAAR